MIYSQFQRASIDEAYIDASEEVNKRICEEIDSYDVNEDGPWVDWTECATMHAVSGTEKMISSRSWSDLQLRIGCNIANEIRATCLHELGYTMSAGIAHNKTLAKLCTSLNKPNGQVRNLI